MQAGLLPTATPWNKPNGTRSKAVVAGFSAGLKVGIVAHGNID